MNTGTILDAAAGGDAARSALIVDRSISYGELAASVRWCATGLAAHGVTPGRRVAVAGNHQKPFDAGLGRESADEIVERAEACDGARGKIRHRLEAGGANSDGRDLMQCFCKVYKNNRLCCRIIDDKLLDAASAPASAVDKCGQLVDKSGQIRNMRTAHTSRPLRFCKTVSGIPCNKSSLRLELMRRKM